MTEPIFPEAPSMICEVLDVFFLTYRVRTERQGTVLQVPGFPGLTIRGEASWPHGPTIVQVDILLGLPDGREICESVVGTSGQTPRELVGNAMRHFFEGSFPVLMTAYFGQPEREDVACDPWTIHGIARNVIMGSITFRYGFPGYPDSDEMHAFRDRLFDWFDDLLNRATLSSGDHWIRVYHSQHHGKPCANEVLLDNQPWPEAEATLMQLEWPAQPELSDARYFLVIRDAQPTA